MVKKVSIIGSGAVGATTAFHLLSLLDLKELVLIDLSGDLAKGIALDLEDTRGILNFSTKVKGSKNLSHIKDSEIVVITAGIARRDGMTREDLLKINAKIAKDLSFQIKKFAPFSVVVCVTNPLDVITYVVTKETKFARTRVLGMGGLLDTSRLYNIIFEETKVSPSSFSGFTFGLHSQDMVVPVERVKLGGEDLEKFMSQDAISRVVPRIQQRGAEIVSFLKNRSAHFAPSLACAKLVEAIAKDKNKIIPVSVLLQGEYGLKDVCMGVPCVVNRKGIEQIIEIELSEREKVVVSKVKDFFAAQKKVLCTI